MTLHLTDPNSAQRGTYKVAQPRHAPREQGRRVAEFFKKIRGGIEKGNRARSPRRGTSGHLKSLEEIRDGGAVPRSIARREDAARVQLSRDLSKRPLACTLQFLDSVPEGLRTGIGELLRCLDGRPIALGCTT